MAGLRSAEEVLANELKEIYSAQRQLTRALPKLAKKVSSERLREMLDHRREQGTMLIERLDDVFEEMQVNKGRAKNPVAEGLLDDTNQHLELVDDERLVDPVLLADTQKIEHYCIAAWGTARSLGGCSNKTRSSRPWSRCSRKESASTRSSRSWRKKK